MGIYCFVIFSCVLSDIHWEDSRVCVIHMFVLIYAILEINKTLR